jgi:hypothetical protein
MVGPLPYPPLCRVVSGRTPSYCLSDCTGRRGNPPVLPWQCTPNFALSAAGCEEYCLWHCTVQMATGGIGAG